MSLSTSAQPGSRIVLAILAERARDEIRGGGVLRLDRFSGT
ncbi:hypothetical protein [Streptomyces uncialis]